MDTEVKISSIDPIRVSVIGSRLDAISKEIGQTMLRTSRSPIFSEARDFVTAIFDKDLRLVAQTAYIPVLMGALPYAIRSIAETFAGDVNEGDIFILNDPYRGNNHPPDINIAKPVFYKGNIEFWSICKGHHADVGGGGVAGYNPEARSVWEECIRIPPAKLYDAGKPNKALWDTILLNVHLPFLVEGDLHCEVGAVTRGERSLLSLLNKYGPDQVNLAIDQIFDASEKQMRAAIAGVPDGEYTAERFVDHDGINKDQMIAVRLTIRVENEDITFDFSGSDPQAAGYVNSPVPNTLSSAYLALFMSIGSEIRFNEGALRALHAVAPAGSIVNPSEPAPVTGCTINTAQTIIEAAWLALSQAVPDKVDAGWARWCAPATMGLNPRTGRLFGDIHFMCKGGGGASKGLDGWDHMGTVVCAGGCGRPIRNSMNSSIPIRFYNMNTGRTAPAPVSGAGAWAPFIAGGLTPIISPLPTSAEATGKQRCRSALKAAKPAPQHQLYLKKGDETIDVDAESFYDYSTGDIFEIYQSGGGGFGDPLRRSVERVKDDVVNGLISVDKAREDYGVVIDPESFAVDEAKTQTLRS